MNEEVQRDATQWAGLTRLWNAELERRRRPRLVQVARAVSQAEDCVRRIGLLLQQEEEWQRRRAQGSGNTQGPAELQSSGQVKEGD